jgi:hypothetical protein
MELLGDNFLPVIPVDEIEHTVDRPFCWNPSCPCHEDTKEIGKVANAVSDGILTPQEATDFVKGRGI